ncbi:MAG: hypothetical protein ABR589_02120 [Chthoniobacterales bacterium]
MSFSHREETRGDQILDILTENEPGIRLIVSRLGAELISLARRDATGNWIGFLYRDDDLSAPSKGWANHATVMGYYLHRLKNQRSLYRGRQIEGGTHSFLRTKQWELAHAKDGRLTYRMERRNFSETEYPLDVPLDLSYEIAGEDVRVRFKFDNREAKATAHVGFGLHPGFAATSFDSFHLSMPPGVYRRHFAPGNFLSGETEDIDFPGGEMPSAREALPGSYILEMIDVPAARFLYSDLPTRRQVALDFTDVPYVTFWSDGGPFLCVEPCWGLTDHHQQRAFEDKEGIQTIAPGAELHASFVMRPRLGVG